MRTLPSTQRDSFGAPGPFFAFLQYQLTDATKIYFVPIDAYRHSIWPIFFQQRLQSFSLVFHSMHACT